MLAAENEARLAKEKKMKKKADDALNARFSELEGKITEATEKLVSNMKVTVTTERDEAIKAAIAGEDVKTSALSNEIKDVNARLETAETDIGNVDDRFLKLHQRCDVLDGNFEKTKTDSVNATDLNVSAFFRYYSIRLK